MRTGQVPEIHCYPYIYRETFVPPGRSSSTFFIIFKETNRDIDRNDP